MEIIVHKTPEKSACYFVRGAFESKPSTPACTVLTDASLHTKECTESARWCLPGYLLIVPNNGQPTTSQAHNAEQLASDLRLPKSSPLPISVDDFHELLSIGSLEITSDADAQAIVGEKIRDYHMAGGDIRFLRVGEAWFADGSSRPESQFGQVAVWSHGGFSLKKDLNFVCFADTQYRHFLNTWGCF